MQDIVFENVCKIYEKSTVIDNLNLRVKKGERLILLGPSGCGKSTILRMIAGLEKISDGKLYMGERCVNDVDCGDRNIAMVFQNYALFPHMTVKDNILYGLKVHKVPQKEMEQRLKQVLEMLDLAGYEMRKPKELSGGQRQRVALARAVVKKADYFLLDEPLSNLDAQLRLRARKELVKIHEMFKPTMVYVTHDQIEAMTVAHRIAVMNQGRIQQIDTPANIYHHPANTFVATFIGSPAMNILQAEILDGKIIVGDCALKLPQERLQELGGSSKVLFGLRPEACTPSFESAMINGKVDFVENTGNLKTATLKLATGESFYLQDSDQGLQMEDIRGFNFDWQNVCLFDAESGENLAKVR